MSIYARIDKGVVAELFNKPDDSPFHISEMFHPSLIWTEVTNVSPQPQVGWTATKAGSGYTFDPPQAPKLSLVDQAVLALNAGVNIVSTSAPDLNGAYSVDVNSQHKANSIAFYIGVNNKFPGGASAFPWMGRDGKLRTFPNTAKFLAFATAVTDYAAQLDIIIATGSGTLPASTVTIP